MILVMVSMALVLLTMFSLSSPAVTRATQTLGVGYREAEGTTDAEKP